MNKNIINLNNKGEYHGYSEWYSNGSLYLRTNFKNGIMFGYCEFHEAIGINFFIR